MTSSPCEALPHIRGLGLTPSRQRFYFSSHTIPRRGYDSGSNHESTLYHMLFAESCVDLHHTMGNYFESGVNLNQYPGKSTSHELIPKSFLES